MFDSYWAPTEIAQDALGPPVVSAVAIQPHAGYATRGEIQAMVVLLAVVLFVAFSFPWWVPIGPSLASAAVGVTFLVVYWIRRSWAWHVLRGERQIIGKVAVFFSDRVEVHDEASIRQGRPLESYPLYLVSYSGFTDWANPRLHMGDRTWATARPYGPYIAAALRPNT